MNETSADPNLLPLLIDISGYKSDFYEILELQRRLCELRNAGISPDTVLILQHESIYTTGIHDNPEEYMGLKEKPVRLERGGSVTYHGPGQLVAYFIISLKERGINVLDLIRKIQKASCEALESFGCLTEGRLGKETGVWVKGEEKKIASIGLAVKGFSTLHGIAVNVENSLDFFAPIRPCGYDHEIMTSLSRYLGKKVSIGEFSKEFKKRIMVELSVEKEKNFHKMEEFREYLNEQWSVTAP